MNLEWLLSSAVPFVTLTSLEIVLGIDNIVFIAIVAGRLPENQRDRARIVGLTLAVVTRVLLLFSLSWLMKLTTPFIAVFGRGYSGKDCILLFGGLFLMYKATTEIYHKMEAAANSKNVPEPSSFLSAIILILLVDIIFSLDSVITAVGMVNDIRIMVAAVISAIAVMLLFSGYIVRFVDRNPTIKMLALSFLLLIGVMLVAEGCHQSFPKGYIYFAMAFSLGVEMLNLRLRRAMVANG